MADTYTSGAKARQIEDGTRPDAWATPLNLALEHIDIASAGFLEIDLGTSTTYAMAAFSNGTDSESRWAHIQFTGTPASAVTITLPASVVNKRYRIDNQTGQRLTIKYSAGTGVVFGDGDSAHVWADGTEVYDQGPGHRITAAEIAASVTPVNYAIPSHDVDGVFRPYRYGYVGDGVADDWDAIQDTVAVLNEVGGGTFLFPSGTTPLVYAGSQTGDCLQFADCTGVSVLGYGCTPTIDLGRTITTSIGNFMSFDNCHNINIDGFATNGPVLDIASSTVKSAVFARFVNGCTDIKMPNNSVTNWQSGPIFDNRDGSGYPLSAATRCRGVEIGALKVTNCWYGLHCQFSGDDLVCENLITDTIHRSVFNYGVQNQRIYVRSKDHQGEDVRLLSWRADTYDAQDLKNIYLKYSVGTDSDDCAAARKIMLGWWGIDPQVVDGIHIEFDVELAAADGTAGGDVLLLEKLNDAAGFDTTTSRGHTMKNIKLSGRIKGNLNGGVLQAGMIGTDPNCDFDGETFSGKWDFDLNCETTTQLYFELGGFDADAVVNMNINAPDANIDFRTNGSTLTLPSNPAIDLMNTRTLTRYSNVSGPVLALEYMNAGSTSPTCSTGWCKGSLKRLTSRNAGGSPCVWALPAATVGLRIGAMRTDAVVFRLDPNGTEVIRGGGAGKYYGTNTDGASLTLVCHTAGTWEIEQETGTWAFEP